MLEDQLYQQSVLRGTIYLPPNKERDKVVEYCLVNEVVFVKSSDPTGENVFGPILIASHLLNEVEFPNGDELGSTVTCLLHPIFNTYEVIAVYKKSGQRGRLFEEGSFRVSKEAFDSTFDVNFSSLNGSLSVLVRQSKDSAAKSTVSFLNQAGQAELELYVQGLLSLLVDNELAIRLGKELSLGFYKQAELKTLIRYVLESGLTYKDEFENELALTKDGVSIKTKQGEQLTLSGGFTIKTEKEDLKSIVADLIQEIESLIIQTPNGAGKVGPTSTLALEKIKTRLNNLFK